MWGARTLAGNDTDYKYVPVRRFLIAVEQSIKQATARFVFEANDAGTWAQVIRLVEKSDRCCGETARCRATNPSTPSM